MAGCNLKWRMRSYLEHWIPYHSRCNSLFVIRPRAGFLEERDSSIVGGVLRARRMREGQGQAPRLSRADGSARRAPPAPTARPAARPPAPRRMQPPARPHSEAPTRSLRFTLVIGLFVQ
ncbi:unnamed protein product [Plutella xylostella]|uniref:(diamondback moth) hypothetical protein n=1 Tax=Plutella xylostella TaxID=51655 RepID=A0A8S4E4N7_PLUXY|nr:unnamed protein product [Plutella xylostella]